MLKIGFCKMQPDVFDSRITFGKHDSIAISLSELNTRAL